MLLSAPLIDRDKPWSKISKDLAGADRQGRKRPPLLPNFFPFDFCANAPKTHTRAHTAHTHPPQFNPKLNGSLRALRRTHPTFPMLRAPKPQAPEGPFFDPFSKTVVAISM